MYSATRMVTVDGALIHTGLIFYGKSGLSGLIFFMSLQKYSSDAMSNYIKILFLTPALCSGS
jgi:hypothetical protein